MSAQRRAGGPIRQLSLQQPQSSARRRPLRKQSSEDIWDSSSGSLRILANAIQHPSNQNSRAQVQPPHRPRPPKLAWTERRTGSPGQESPDVPVEVIAQRCKGLPRPATAKPVTQEALNDSRQRLAERLRLAWQQRHPTRPNLDIFLAHNSSTFVNQQPSTENRESSQKEVTLELGKTNEVVETDSERKICEPIARKPEESSSEESAEEGEVSERESGESEENKEECEENAALMRKASANTNRSGKPQEGHSPPPPRRLMSAPTTRPRTATPQQSERPPPPRRRLKSVRRRPHRTDEEISSGEDIEHKPRRSRSARTSEVVTMVSLLSPGHSEQEDEEIDPPLQPLLTTSIQSFAWIDKTLSSVSQTLTSNSTNVKSTVNKTTPITTTVPAPTICLRKPVKTVSFQHGGSNLSRTSYVNNFPLRRGAASPPDITPAEPPSQAPAGPALKRKLFRTKSNTVTDAGPILNEVETPITVSNCSVEEPLNLECDLNITQIDTPVISEVSTPVVDTEEIISEYVNNVPEFKSPKEQECWDLFRRMVDKGITVSFETVLRGMLTPTEYRLRKHDLLAS